MYKNKKIQNKEFILLALILVIISVFFILILKYDKGRIKEISIDNFSTDGIQYFIDEDIEINEDIIIDNCWAFKENEVINTFDTSIVLKNVETNISYMIPTCYEERKDVEEAYGIGYNYNRSGFYGRVSGKKLDINNNRYEVIIRYNNNENNMFIPTGIIIGGN